MSSTSSSSRRACPRPPDRSAASFTSAGERSLRFFLSDRSLSLAFPALFSLGLSCFSLPLRASGLGLLEFATGDTLLSFLRGGVGLLCLLEARGGLRALLGLGVLPRLGDALRRDLSRLLSLPRSRSLQPPCTHQLTGYPTAPQHSVSQQNNHPPPPACTHACMISNCQKQSSNMNTHLTDEPQRRRHPLWQEMVYPSTISHRSLRSYFPTSVNAHEGRPASHSARWNHLSSLVWRMLAMGQTQH